MKTAFTAEIGSFKTVPFGLFFPRVYKLFSEIVCASAYQNFKAYTSTHNVLWACFYAVETVLAVHLLFKSALTNYRVSTRAHTILYITGANDSL